MDCLSYFIIKLKKITELNTTDIYFEKKSSISKAK